MAGSSERPSEESTATDAAAYQGEPPAHPPEVEPRADPRESGPAAPKRKRRVKISLASLVALVTLATGFLTLKDQLFGGNDGGPTRVVVPSRNPSEIPRFDGVAGHLEQSRALLDFFDQHNGEVVQLRVGFPELIGAGFTSSANVVAKRVPMKGDGTVGPNPVDISLMTECHRAVPPTVTNPTFADGCTGTDLVISEPQTSDSGTTFEHGVPVIDGYFKVDVTGALQNGFTPIDLKPLTFQQATAS